RVAGRRRDDRRACAAEDADGPDRRRRAGRGGPRLQPQLRISPAAAAARRRAGVRAPVREEAQLTTTQYEQILSRRVEVIRRSVGIDYERFRRGSLAWDYEGLMAAVGYDLEAAATIQLERGV